MQNAAGYEVGKIVREVSDTRVIACKSIPPGMVHAKDWFHEYRILDQQEDGQYVTVSVEESLPNAIQRAHLLA